VAFEALWTRPKLDPKGKAVLITGCDSGFGRLAVKRFRALGFKVFANFLKQENVEILKKELSAASAPSYAQEIHPLVFDVTDEKAVIAAREEIKKALPEGTGLWGLVNNAGISKGYFVEVTPLEDYHAVLNVNFFAMVSVTKQFLPLLRQAKGRVVNVTSLAGVLQCPAMSAYAASKHAGEAFSDALRVEVKPFGMEVSIIEPGFMRTNIIVTGPAHAKELIAKNPELSAEYTAKWGRKFGNFSDVTRVSGDPMLVVNAWIHALTAQHPRHRYIVGRFSWVVVLHRFLPTRIFDYLSYAIIGAN